MQVQKQPPDLYPSVKIFVDEGERKESSKSQPHLSALF
jgi:hypothetical protein